MGRYVLAPAIFEHLEKIGQGAGGEIQLTDGIAALMKEEAVYAHRFTGKRYDCGSKLGYLQATVEFGLGHPQLGKEFGKYLQSLNRETINSIAAKGNEYVQVDRRKNGGRQWDCEASGADYGAGTEGIHRTTTAPVALSVRFARLRRPPCASTISRHSVSPRPVPVAFVEKKGSSASRSTSGVRPLPRSATSMTNSPAGIA